MNLQIINPIEYEGWDDLLLSNQNYSFFHSSAWAKVLQETYRYTPIYFTIFKNGKPQTLVPVMQVDSFLTGKRGISLPFTDYSDAIIPNGTAFDSLFEHIIQYGKNHGWKSFEIRGGQSVPLLGPDSYTYSRHILDLSKGTNEIFLSFKANARRNTKKAIKKGVSVEVLNTWDSVKEFYRLNLITRKRHGIPPQPLNFFRKVYEHIVSKNLGFVVLASYEDKTIAGAVFFHLGKKAAFKYGASDKYFLRLRPNNLVMWESIKWFSQNGYMSICFGRTGPEDKGLRDFKAGWGTKETIENYYKYNLKKNEFVEDSRQLSKLYRHLFRRMPQPFLTLIGSILYRHTG